MCEAFGLTTGWFPSGSERDMDDMDIGAWMVVFGKDALTDLTGIVCRTFGEEDNDFAKFGIRTFTN